MASDPAVSAVLALLQELYPTREVSPAALDAWALVFADWSDEELRSCAVLAARQPGRTFFPTPGEIAACRPVPAAPVIDPGAVLRQISALGQYLPAAGWVYPGVERVRERLGDAVANAYAAGGEHRLFAEDATTQGIARGAFAREMAAAPPSRHLGNAIGGGRPDLALPAPQM